MINEFIKTIKQSKSIALFTHIGPDADALCSSLAIKNLIINNFKDKIVDFFIDGEISNLYNPIIQNENISTEYIKNHDLIIVLDCPSAKRTGKFADVIIKSPFVINIDHHENNEKFGNINIVATKCSCTCEIIQRLLKFLNLKTDNNISKYLYQGILTDTNNFTSLNITRKTHKALFDILEFKFDSNAIKEYYFNNDSREKLELVAKTLKTVKFYLNEALNIMTIDNKSLTKSNIKFEDTLGIVDNGLKVSSTEISAIIIEKQPGLFHVSLRSRGKINAAEIAKKFKGGGYINVAAFQTRGTLEKVCLKIIDKVKKAIEQQNQIEKKSNNVNF